MNTMRNEIPISERTGIVGGKELPCFYQIGDEARITFLDPDVVATVTKVHFARNKVLYDFEVSYFDDVIIKGLVTTRIHNIDSALVYSPPTEG